MQKLVLGLAGGLVGLGLVAANATPLPPARPDAGTLAVTKVQMDEGSSTTVIKKRGLMGDKTTVVHRRSEPQASAVVVKHRTEVSSDCKNVTVKKEDGMGNSVTKHKTTC